MTANSEIPKPNDPGLTALVMLLRFHGMGQIPPKFVISVGPPRSALPTWCDAQRSSA